MKTKLLIFLIIFFSIININNIYADAEIIFSSEKGQFVLKNNLFSRTIQVDRKNNAFYTVSFKNLVTGYELSQEGSDEFAFKVDGTELTGGISCGMFSFLNYEIETGRDERKTLIVRLSGLNGTAASGLRVSLYYEIYPDLPMVRKWISIKNESKKEKTITGLEWERLNLNVGYLSHAEVYADYGQMIHRVPFIGGVEDPAVLVYDSFREEGFIVGNEAPGIMKRIEVYHYTPRISIMSNPESEWFPFKKYLKSDETFVSPKGFIILYKGKKWQDAFDGHLADYIRKYMGVKLFERKEMPTFLYNTWDPFRKDINEKLIIELVDEVAPTGVEYFIIDDGWQDNRGDWNVDKNKFPNGLTTVTDYIISKGMKPGLWFSVTDVYTESKMYQTHREWVVLNKDGKEENLHTNLKGEVTMCLCTPWFDYIRDKISSYVSSCNIGYLKLDISAVRSAYVQDPQRSGCYASHHQGHKDREESLLLLYRRTMQLYDELKKKHPDLYIDCTFEIWGYFHVIDYALIQHADGDWLSNIRFQPPKGSLIARQLCYERSRTIPASTMIIGNQKMNDPNHEFSFHSLFSMTPIMLGDPRELNNREKKWYKEWHDWLKTQQEKYEILKFHQISDVFQKPTYSGWDGCARFNKEKNGGILCFYRNNSPESSRIFQIPWVDEKSTYKIYSPRLKKTIGSFTGEHLKTNGLKVEIPRRNQAEILSIEK